MPQGIVNAPSTFSRFMYKIFEKVLPKGYLLIYLDDLLIASRTVEEHMEHLDEVFKVLAEHKLYAKLSKCHFGMRQVKFLGHIASEDGIAPNSQ